MSIIDIPLLPCVGCGRPTCGACEGCTEPLCGVCGARGNGRCVACAEARAALNTAIVEYERSVL